MKKTGIKIAYFNATTDFEQRLARATAGNALPDLIFNDAASLGQFIQLGIAEEIDPQAIAGGDQLFQTAWKSTRYIDGKYYGVPTSAQTFALFVRKTGVKNWGCRSLRTGMISRRWRKPSPLRIPMVTAK